MTSRPLPRRGKASSDQRCRAALAAIVAVALGLRLWGVGFGLPYRYHPDERGHVVEAARMGASRSLRPSTFDWPPLYAYVLMGEYAASLGIGLATGQYSSVDDFSERMNADPSPLYLLARITSALAGAATVLVVYAIGRLAESRRVGLLAAGLLAVAFLPARDSHYAVNDAVLSLLSAASLLGSVMIARRGLGRDYLLAGCAAGLAFATKYTAAFLVASVVIAHVGASGSLPKAATRPALRSLALALVGFVLAACAGSPYFVLAPREVWRDISSSIYAYGRTGFEGWRIDPAGGYLFYLKSLWWGLGAGLSVLSLVGVIWTLVRRRPTRWVLVSYPVLLAGFMGTQQMFFARFLLPALPPFIILAAATLDDLMAAVARRAGPAIQRLVRRRESSSRPMALGHGVLVACAGTLLALQPAATSVRHDHLLTQADTRTLAKEWVEANIPAGSRVAVDWPHHGPPLATPADPQPDSSRAYDVWIVGGHGLPDHSLEEYRAAGVEYLVSSSFLHELTLVDAAQDAQRREFYASLDRELELVQEFAPWRVGAEPRFVFDELYGPAVSVWQRERPGPVLRVYVLGR